MTETKDFKILQQGFISSVFGILYNNSIINIPENKIGNCSVVDDFDIEDSYIFQLLKEDGIVIDDNHLDNLKKHEHLFKIARGRILISGLGLGFSLYKLLKIPKVQYIRVIEKNQNVIDLVKPFFKEYFDKVDFVNGDIFNYKLNDSFNIIYHSIWYHKQDIMNEEISILKNKFEKNCAWHGFIFKK